jgi:hypothetical protein
MRMVLPTGSSDPKSWFTTVVPSTATRVTPRSSASVNIAPATMRHSRTSM